MIFEAYFWFALSTVFAMISIHYFMEASQPTSKRLHSLDNMIAYQIGFSTSGDKKNE